MIMEIEMKAKQGNPSYLVSMQKPILGATIRPVRRNQDGSMLIEVLISVLIFSMGVLALVGLQANTVKFAADSKFRSDAGFLANQAVAQMSIDYANIPSYANGAAPPASYPATDTTKQAKDILPGGWRTITAVPSALIDPATGRPDSYTITVTVGWVTPGGPDGSATTSPHRYYLETAINGN
ncbi:hypothetical protein BH11PSE11_BH11PSE11_12670 [soil metagenome]